MNKNKILSGGGKNLTGGGKWGWRGREVGGEGEGSGVKGGGKWGERGREVGVEYPPVHPLKNYRPISVTPILCRLLETIVIEKLLSSILKQMTLLSTNNMDLERKEVVF